MLVVAGQRALADTWSFDGTRWARHAPRTAAAPFPSARSEHTVWAAAVGEAWLFGGRALCPDASAPAAADNASAELWRWRAASGGWSRANASASARGPSCAWPAPRHAHSASGVGAQMWVFGGSAAATGQPLADLWSMNASAASRSLGSASASAAAAEQQCVWTKHSPAAAAPAARAAHTAWWHEEQRTLFVQARLRLRCHRMCAPLCGCACVPACILDSVDSGDAVQL